MQDPNLNLVVIFESENPVEIGLATSALEDAGIEFAVAAELPAGYGFGPLLNPTSRIQVAASTEERARAVLEDLFAADIDALASEDGSPEADAEE